MGGKRYKIALAASVLAGWALTASPTVAYADWGFSQYIGSTNSNPTVSQTASNTMGNSTAGTSQYGGGFASTSSVNQYLQSGAGRALNQSFRNEFKTSYSLISSGAQNYDASTRAYLLAVTKNSTVVSGNRNNGGFVPGSIDPTRNTVSTGPNGTITVVQSGTQYLLSNGSRSALQAQAKGNLNCTTETTLTNPADSRFAWAWQTKTVCKPNTVAQPVVVQGGGVKTGKGTKRGPVKVGLADNNTSNSQNSNH